MIRSQGGIAIAAHPVSTRKLEPQTYHLWSRRAELVQEIDAWEVASGPHLFKEVQMSRLPMVANSDLHHPRHPDASGVVKNRYLPGQIFADASTPVLGGEVSLFGERTTNPDTEEGREALWASIGYAFRRFEAQIAYGETQANAVPAMFTNSDFGNGTTDVRGVVASLRWDFTTHMSLRLTQFLSRLQISTSHLAYNRSHLDLSASF